MNDHYTEPGHETEPHQLTPRIWVGSLADYNAGRLHGDWIDAATDPADIHAHIRQILATSTETSAEEWGIFDHDDFGTYTVGEYEPIETVAAIARGIAEHGEAFAAWAQLHDSDPDTLDQFTDSYLGTYQNAEEWARDTLDASGLNDILDRSIHDSLRSYLTIDYQSFARDCQLGGEIHIEDTPDGDIWVFRTD